MNFPNIDVQGLRSAFNKVKAAVMNLTEIEQKVKEATSSETWGASTTMMQEIAKATFSHDGFNEVMPAIYRRFSQDGRTWRNIYKALVLIEFIVKNGSDRAVEYCKSHIYDVKACMSFQHTDEKGKDQGVNIRHRSTIIAEMLQDEGLIREERQKAREFANRQLTQASTVEHQGYGSFLSSDFNKFGANSTGSASNRYENSRVDNKSGFPGFSNQSSLSNLESRDQYNSSAQKNTTSTYGKPYSNNVTGWKETPVNSEFSEFQSAAPARPKSVNLLDFEEIPVYAQPFTPAVAAPIFAKRGLPLSEDEEWAEFSSAPAGTSSKKIEFTSAQKTDGIFQTVPANNFNAFPSSNNNGSINNNVYNFSEPSWTQQEKITVTPATLMMNPDVVNLDNISQFNQPHSAKSVGPSMNSMIFQAQSQQKSSPFSSFN